MSEIVTLQYPKSNIAEITLEDRVSHNTFSAELIQGLMRAFANLKPDTKVVVLHGYENYFCCGGTQEELLKLAEGNTTFADSVFYRVLLDCEVPTISAMQGHALGGGLALGCFADIILMSKESLYSTNFMKYGFTPGMGSTYIIPKKFGEALGNEMLFSAKSYHGGDLMQRGISLSVLNKQEVIPHAMELATELAEKPLISLKLLKQHLTKEIKAKLPEIIKDEVAMHAVTFVLPEVKERIMKLFGK